MNYVIAKARCTLEGQKLNVTVSVFFYDVLFHFALRKSFEKKINCIRTTAMF